MVPQGSVPFVPEPHTDFVFNVVVEDPRRLAVCATILALLMAALALWRLRRRG